MFLEETTTITVNQEKQPYNNSWKTLLEKFTTTEKTDNSEENMLEKKDYDYYNFEYDDSLLALPTPI